MNSIVFAWAAEVGFVTWRSLTGEHIAVGTGGSTVNPDGKSGLSAITPTVLNDGVKRPPFPSEIVASVIAFGTFGLIAEKDAKIGNLLAWGLVLATGLLVFSAKSPTGSTGTAAAPSTPATSPGGTTSTTPAQTAAGGGGSAKFT